MFIDPPSTVQATLGGFIKPLMADTLQVSEYISPAVAMPERSTLTWIALEGTKEKIEEKTKISVPKELTVYLYSEVL